MGGFRNPGLRVPRHRTTTAHLCAAYPFQAEGGLGGRGVYLGTDELAGGATFCFDPFELYTRGTITNPNVLVIGEPGWGKSTLVKLLLYRSVGVLSSPGGGPRWVAISDPKGEYGPMADALGLQRIKLGPGGVDRINPLDAGPGAALVGPEGIVARRIAMVVALLADVLGRRLMPLEDAAVGWAVELLGTTAAGPQPTLADLARLLAVPTSEMADRAGCSAAELASGVRDARFALGKLLDRDLRGMFDGPSTVRTDWAGRGIVIDLSAVHQNQEALSLVMVAATAWLQALMAFPESEETPRRYQALDEAYVLLRKEHTAVYLQSCWKLCRHYGVANILIGHKITDLSSQADDGTATAKIAEGLLADTQTRILFRQATDQVESTARLLQLTSAEAGRLASLRKGQALWKVAGRAALVQAVVGPGERAMCDTNKAVVVPLDGRPSGEGALR